MKKKLMTVLLTSSMLATSMMAPMTASADELTDNITKQDQKLEEIKGSISSAQELLSAVQAELAATEARANELLAQRDEAQTKIEELTKEIEKLQAIIDKREDQLKDQARSVQVNGSNTNYMNFVFASESLTDLFARVDVVATMVSANKDMVEQQVADQNLVEEKKASSEEKLSEIIGMSSELEELKADLEIKKIEEESAIAALNANKATVQADRDRFVAEKEAADRRAAEEAARLAAAEAAAVAAAEEAARAAQAPAIESVTEVASTNYAPSIHTVENTVEVSESQVVEEQVVENVAAAAPTQTATPAPVPAPAPTPAPAPAPSYSGNVVSEAYKYLGVPYVWGGRTPAGFDCSGFTSYVYKQAYGIDIGGWTVPQENAGTRISVSQAQAGDLLFWGSAGSTYHVAISLGDGSYIHAPFEGRNVEVNYVKYFTPDFAVRVN
ncbi:Peptidoglycan DL-endopeptidase CwlO [Jeotgalibaca dankookensis]|uniref:Peptidoglycan DL-endopeptidase CwlO n=1 Tax=Jeotgalibaca dankookensis TaxID=708126 RepID=A0A1S6IQN4_9LACT|nr:C40 family peptidase [Jeotgalibaca dankookensis]AQS53868.1 Peptidoglycan DL-endopeptidase CwlO [Jeotgalibaca dankookensis]